MKLAMTESKHEEKQRSRAAESGWWTGARFGMFIHWGPYSVAGRGEWVMNRERIPYEVYRREYAETWKAEKFDPAKWVQLAREAGMAYMVMTTRHHDGFALWDTATTPFSAAKMGPGRDLVRPFAEAVRAGGLRVGFYLSAADWTHSDYPGSTFRDWPAITDWRDEASRGRFVSYYQAQVRELMSNYGRVDLLWWDGCVPSNLDGEVANADALRLQPHILINERNGEPWDIAISEQAIKARKGVPWEACMTLNGNWGYHAGDSDWKSARDVINMLLKTTCGGGNLLLNVGPRADGSIPERSVEILHEVGAWLRRHHGLLDEVATYPSPFTWNNTVSTMVGLEKVFLFFQYQPGPRFCWAEMKNRVKSARFRATGLPVRFRQEGPYIFLEDLPTPLPDPTLTVIELETEGKPEALTAQTSFWIPGE
jgi:alpha-L-fucosidase